MREYAQAHAETIRVYHKQHYDSTRQERLEWARQYRVEHRDEILRRRREHDARPESQDRRARYNRMRYKTDPKFASDMRAFASINAAIRTRKSLGTLGQRLGYSTDDLLRHLEAQFPAGMSFENRSEWELDHIVPRCQFDYTSHEDPAFSACWALSNIRPVWREHNKRGRPRQQ
jgi:hypothetical protein